MTLLRVAAAVVAVLSLVVLRGMLGTLWRAQRRLKLMGIDEPLPVDAKAKAIVWAWIAALLASAGALVWSLV